MAQADMSLRLQITDVYTEMDGCDLELAWLQISACPASWQPASQDESSHWTYWETDAYSHSR